MLMYIKKQIKLKAMNAKRYTVKDTASICVVDNLYFFGDSDAVSWFIL